MNMRLSSVSFNNPISYKATTNTANNQAASIPAKQDVPQKTSNKMSNKTMLVLAGLGVLALGICFRKNIGKLFNSMAKSTEKESERIKPSEIKSEISGESLKPSERMTVTPIEQQKTEEIEEIVPEVVDFDEVFGPRIKAKRQQRQQPPKTILIDEKGNVLDSNFNSQSVTNRTFESRFQSSGFNRRTERPNVNPDSKSETIKTTAYDTIDATTDFIILDELLNGGVTRGGKAADDMLGGAVKNDSGFFDSFTERLGDIGDDIGNFFDNIGDGLGDFGESLGDSLGDIF